MRIRTKKNKIQKSAAPEVTEQPHSESVETNETIVPIVLSWEAVRSGMLDSKGSGLPESLEKDVPPEYRFWKFEKEEERRSCRDALVESQMFTDDTLKKINGELRRVEYKEVVKMYLPPEYDDQKGPTLPPSCRPIEKVASYLVPYDQDTVLFDEQVTAAVGLPAILEKVSILKSQWVIAADNTEENRNLFKPHGGFVLKATNRLVFASSAQIEYADLIEMVTTTKEQDMLSTAFNHITILKDNTEERIIYGIVLEPNEVDAQDDTISAEEIRSACHKFMEDHGNLGLQHKEIITGKVKLLENFIAPISFDVDGETVKAGTWLIKERVLDDELWSNIKLGKITGYSIGGSAVRVPVE